jgi:hypothetical protein
MVNSYVTTEIANTIKEEQTPLNNLFFSRFNQLLVQRLLRAEVKDRYNVRIDYQNSDDMLALMRMVFVNNSANPYGDICSQVRFMNAQVVNQALPKVVTGLSQYYGYLRDITAPMNPPSNPVNTSSYGEKFGYNNQIGL